MYIVDVENDSKRQGTLKTEDAESKRANTVARLSRDKTHENVKALGIALEPQDRGRLATSKVSNGADTRRLESYFRK